EDYRLRADSPGKGAGKDGRDLGADVDLVGPGAAYERWKQTPEHQQWLQDTGQAGVNRPAGRPFVILSRGGRAEQPLATLAEAVAVAQAGDTIEIRGNGPFLTESLHIAQRLILRAGEGFRPILRLGTDSVAAGGPLMEIQAPLTLEGLELQRLNAPVLKSDESQQAILFAIQAPLRVANCHFVMSGERGRQSNLNCVRAAGSPACELHNSSL